MSGVYGANQLHRFDCKGRLNLNAVICFSLVLAIALNSICLLVLHVRTLTLQEELENYLAEPSADGFISVRNRLIEDATYVPTPATLQILVDLFDRAEYESLMQSADDFMPAWALCPRLHTLCEQAALARNDTENAELYGFLRETCLWGVLASGDGLLHRPFLVTYPSDQNDVLAALNRKASTRQVIQSAGKWYERVVCENAQQVWFDIDDLLRAQNRQIPARKTASSRSG